MGLTRLTGFSRMCMPGLFLGVTLWAQNAATGSSEPLAVVNRLMSASEIRIITGFDMKALYRSGDSVAVEIARTQPRTALRDPTKARSAIFLLATAFENPNLIVAEENKNPGVSLLLLDSIIRESSDAKVQQDARDLMARLETLAQVQRVQ